MKLLSTFSFIFCLFTAHSQSFTFKVGANYNATVQKLVPENLGVSLRGFDPKYGYQAGILYKQPLFKLFFAAAEIGYLNKGHQRILSSTKKNLGNVNYNYLYLAPNIGYNLPFGFSIKTGISFNYLLNYNGSTIGEIQKNDYAFLATLIYTYKKIGLELSYNKSIRPMQKIVLAGQGFNHYHEWYAASLSYTFFKKRIKIL